MSKAQEIHDTIKAAIEGAINPEEIGKKIASDPGLMGMYGMCKILGRIERHLRVCSHAIGNETYAKNVMTNMTIGKTKFKANKEFTIPGTDFVVRKDHILTYDGIELESDTSETRQSKLLLTYGSSSDHAHINEILFEKLLKYNMLEVAVEKEPNCVVHTGSSK